MKINLSVPNTEDPEWRAKRKQEIDNYYNSIYSLKVTAGTRIIACDGAGPRVREDRKYGGIGVVVYDSEDGKMVETIEAGACYCDEKMTNNLAEVLALWMAVQTSISFGDGKKTVILTDSLIIYNAIVCGENAPVETQTFVDRIIKYLEPNISICWIPRELNMPADKVSKDFAEKITESQKVLWDIQ